MVVCKLGKLGIDLSLRKKGNEHLIFYFVNTACSADLIFPSQNIIKEVLAGIRRGIREIPYHIR